MKAAGFGAKLKKAFTDLMGLVKADPKAAPVHESIPRLHRVAGQRTLHDAIAALTKRLGPPMRVEREVPKGRKPSDATPRGVRVYAFTPSPRVSRRARRLDKARAARRRWRAGLIAKAAAEGRKSWRWCHEIVQSRPTRKPAR